MKKSEILVQVKGMVQYGGFTFICTSIQRFGRENACFGTAANLRTWVSDLMNGCYTYEDWLKEHHPNLKRTMSPVDFKQARLQWLDWMIQYWQEQERGE
jgi:hypothetical protein